MITTFVSNGQTVSDAILLNDDQQIVLAGGTALSTVVSSGGQQTVSSGGLARLTTVSSGRHGGHQQRRHREQHGRRFRRVGAHLKRRDGERRPHPERFRVCAEWRHRIVDHRAIGRRGTGVRWWHGGVDCGFVGRPADSAVRGVSAPDDGQRRWLAGRQQRRHGERQPNPQRFRLRAERRDSHVDSSVVWRAGAGLRWHHQRDGRQQCDDLTAAGADRRAHSPRRLHPL
jgi:autotransporter passenger strand-loop-strand repeat protein